MNEDDEDSEFSIEEQTLLGRKFAETFHMRRSVAHPDRWATVDGTKTDLGVYRTVKRMLRESVVP